MPEQPLQALRAKKFTFSLTVWITAGSTNKEEGTQGTIRLSYLIASVDLGRLAMGQTQRLDTFPCQVQHAHTAMNVNEYKILAYAKSEVDRDGKDFIIVLRSNQETGVRVQSFLLECWKSMFDSTNDIDFEYAQDFLYDLRQQAHRNKGGDSNFFESLSDLSIGPLRTSTSGHFEIRDISLIHDELNSQCPDVCACSEEAFSALSKALTTGKSPVDGCY